MQLQVARIGKPHGIRGEVTVQVLTDAPGDRFVPGTQFVVEPASAGPLTILSARWNKDILLLAFEEIETRNEAETVRGAKLFIETEELDDDDDDEGWYEHELEGLEVRVGDQVVGKVSGLRTLPVQDLLVVTADGRQGSPDPLRRADRPRGQRRGGLHPGHPAAGPLRGQRRGRGHVRGSACRRQAGVRRSRRRGRPRRHRGQRLNEGRRRQHLPRVPGAAGTLADRQGAPGRAARAQRPRPQGLHHGPPPDRGRHPVRRRRRHGHETRAVGPGPGRRRGGPPQRRGQAGADCAVTGGGAVHPGHRPRTRRRKSGWCSPAAATRASTSA